MSALSTAAILGLAAATGSQIAGAAIQNHAAGNAVNAQTDASNKALAVGQGVYNDQKAAAQPYQTVGTMALGRLGAMPQNTAQFDPRNYSGGAPVAPQAGQGMPAQPMLPQQPQMGAQPTNTEPMVTLQAPDGTTKQFPQSQAQRYIAAGAKVVNGGMVR